jgi:uncharacterized membrane protein YbaN (DUF454 family)
MSSFPQAELSLQDMRLFRRVFKKYAEVSHLTTTITITITVTVTVTVTITITITVTVTVTVSIIVIITITSIVTVTITITITTPPSAGGCSKRPAAVVRLRCVALPNKH